MIIPVTDDYRIKSDSRQWSVQKKIKPTKQNQAGWESFAYYSSFSQAMNGLGERLHREIDVEGIQGVVEATNALTRLLAGLDRLDIVPVSYYSRGSDEGIDAAAEIERRLQQLEEKIREWPEK